MSARILVTGSREFTDRPTLRKALDDFGFAHGFRGLTVVHGNARGADALAQEWVGHNWDIGVRPEIHEADWEGICRAECGPRHRRRQRHRPGVTICPAAGNYRNQDMVGAGADVCLAFLVAGLPCKGTRDCMRRAEAAGIPVRVFEQGATP